MRTEAKSSTLADGVAQNLLGYIRKENLVPGDLLPKEEELAAQLNVSRHIIREGVSRLKAFGLVESRKCRGTVVSRPNAFAGMHRLAQAELFSVEEWKEFVSLRIALEIGMADFIHARATAEDIAQLRKLAGPPTMLHTVAEEVAFHSKLFAIGGNLAGNQFMEALVTSFKYQFTDKRDDLGQYKMTHMDLCDALESGTREDFTEVLKNHFKPHINWLLNNSEGGVELIK